MKKQNLIQFIALFCCIIIVFSRCSKDTEVDQNLGTINYIKTIGSPGTGLGEFYWDSKHDHGRFAHDGTFLYVVDDKNYRIQRFDSNYIVKDWIGLDIEDENWGTYTIDSIGSRVFQPERIVYKNNHLFIVCYYNGFKLLKVDENLNIVKETNITYDEDENFSIRWGGFDIDNNECFYFFDNYVFYRFNSDGNFIGTACDRGIADSIFNTEEMQFCIDENNIIYLSDRENHKLKKFDINFKFLEAWDFEGLAMGEFTIIDNNSIYLYVNDLKEFDLEGNLKRFWYYDFNDIWEARTIKNSKLYIAKNEKILVYSLD